MGNMENVPKNATGSQSRSAKEKREEKRMGKVEGRVGDFQCTEKKEKRKRRKAEQRGRKPIRRNFQSKYQPNLMCNHYYSILIPFVRSFMFNLTEFDDIYTPKSIIVVTLFCCIQPPSTTIAIVAAAATATIINQHQPIFHPPRHLPWLARSCK